jgi:large subunit ribosomal protein L29
MPESIEKFRQMGDQELEAHERELSEQIFRLRFQHATGQAESLKKLRVVRRDLARIKTLRRERELGNRHGK